MNSEHAALARFILWYSRSHGYPPNRREMAEHLDRSPSTTQGIVAQMIDEGILTTVPLTARAVVVTGAAMKQLEEGTL